MEILINRERITSEFVELVSIDAVSFREREMADRLTCKLRELGFETSEDAAGESLGGNAGNIYGFLPGTGRGEPILLSAHMDTVEPGIGKRALVQEDGTITGDGSAVLGADDAAGLVEILEGIRSVRESGLPHGDVEVLFSIGEEAYIQGTNRFDFGKIRSRQAYVLDLSGDVGSAAIQAPSLISFKITVAGKASHAGFDPESGIHAIAAAGRAISEIKQGRVDEETTCNIGTISGGTAANIIPDRCVLSGEVRSFDHKKALAWVEKLRATFTRAAAEEGAAVSMETSVDLTAYRLDEKDRTVERFRDVCRRLGLPGSLTATFGGSDNNNFARCGIRGVVLSCGMFQVHSVREYAKIEELVKGAELVAGLITAR